MPEQQAALKALKVEHGSKSLGEVTVDQCLGGGRGVLRRRVERRAPLADAAGEEQPGE